MSQADISKGHKKCPFCAEWILAEAIKCRYCGSDLDGTQVGERASEHADYSSLRVYRYMLKGGHGPRSVLAASEADARDAAQADAPAGSEIHALFEAHRGKFSCPSCRSAYTDCNRAIGCAVMVIIFISLGLGLIMIPFLPHNCTCLACGYSWKT